MNYKLKQTDESTGSHQKPDFVANWWFVYAYSRSHAINHNEERALNVRNSEDFQKFSFYHIYYNTYCYCACAPTMDYQIY